MDTSFSIQAVLRQFGLDLPANDYGNGHINTTYIVEADPKCILQRVNSDVFHHPEQVMENISLVTEHLRKKIEEAGGDPLRETLTLLPTVDGKPYYVAPDGSCFRLYRFIDGTVSYDTAETPELFAASARAFGKFQKMLADFPSEKLYETIPRFHDTANRLENLRASVTANRSGRADSVRSEIAFALERANQMTAITDAIAAGTIPLRVTHNDTKLNNVMLDPKTGEGVCVVDLDTVMPGSLLYDYGDSLRFGASTGAEDERDLSKISFDLTYFEAYTDAFLSELAEIVTPTEVELLPISAVLMTLECGMRFLDRCRTQFKLVADMESKMDEMKAIVAKCCEKYGIRMK